MISSLGKLLASTPADRRLIFQALALTVGIRAGLRLLPFTTVCRCLDRVDGGVRTPPAAGAHQVGAARIVWAVRAAGSRLPKTTCLVEALVAETLLHRHGHAASLKIGVRRGARPSLDAHAWVECGGAPVIGTTPAMAEYATLEPSRRRG